MREKSPLFLAKYINANKAAIIAGIPRPKAKPTATQLVGELARTINNIIYKLYYLH
ncbi:MAG: hypothetical protein K2M43_03015 [Mycoplasmoidaceae bacterium]|nr:hypothetical protein [Mycoplasmoidaceae bacterium]